jgi:hypothetical protein
MSRLVALAFFLVAACSEPATSPPPDGPASTDAPPLAADGRADAPFTSSVCTTSGNGTLGAQCCVWDHAELHGGPQACADGTWCAPDAGGADQNAGTCQAVPAAPADFYTACDPARGAGACYVGGICMAAPGASSPTCRVLCKPSEVHLYCGGPTSPPTWTCVPITADGEVGQCVSPGGL